MDKKRIYFTAFFMLLAISGLAYGNMTYSGEYIDTYNFNDTPANMDAIESDVETWFLTEKGMVYDVEFNFYSKVDYPDTTVINMTVTYNPDNMTGTWTTTAPVEFYSVKASTQFALYWIQGGATSGLWSTEHLTHNNGGQPEISHFTSWNPIVPAPGALMLASLGTGMIGWMRKRNTL